MSGILKWVESKLEQLDAEPIEGDSDETFLSDTEKALKLKTKIRTIRDAFHQKSQELEEKFTAELEHLREINSTTNNELSQKAEETMILKEKVSAMTIAQSQLEAANWQLMSSIDQLVPGEDSSYEISSLTQQLNLHRQLLAAEKTKTENAVKEQEHWQHTAESVQKSHVLVETQLRESLQEFHTRTTQLEQELSLSADTQPLSELLQQKQRTIENLITEKASLAFELETEREEKLRLAQGYRYRTVFTPCSSVAFLSENSSLSSFTGCLDSFFSEVSQTLQEVPLVRLCFLFYSLVLHLLLFYSFLFTANESFLS